MSNSPAPTSPADKPLGRGDVIAIVAVAALVAAAFLIPVTREFALTSLSAIFDAGYAVGRAATDAARIVASLFGGAA